MRVQDRVSRWQPVAVDCAGHARGRAAVERQPEVRPARLRGGAGRQGRGPGECGRRECEREAIRYADARTLVSTMWGGKQRAPETGQRRPPLYQRTLSHGGVKRARCPSLVLDRRSARAHVGRMRRLLPSAGVHVFDAARRLLLVRQHAGGVWPTRAS